MNENKANYNRSQLKKNWHAKNPQFFKGENNPRWNNGNSEYQDHALLKINRLKILKKSRGKCDICGNMAEVVHHVDGSKDNHKLKNLVSLCNKCHAALHRHEYNERGKRTSVYIRKYGFTLKEIASKFNTSPPTILSWLKKPQTKKWLEEQLPKKQD